ncbi:MAG: hypothetical protein ABIM50_02960 [Novosphingobium sp.]
MADDAGAGMAGTEKLGAAAAGAADEAVLEPAGFAACAGIVLDEAGAGPGGAAAAPAACDGLALGPALLAVAAAAPGSVVSPGVGGAITTGVSASTGPCARGRGDAGGLGKR